MTEGLFTSKHFDRLFEQAYAQEAAHPVFAVGEKLIATPDDTPLSLGELEAYQGHLTEWATNPSRDEHGQVGYPAELLMQIFLNSLAKETELGEVILAPASMDVVKGQFSPKCDLIWGEKGQTETFKPWLAFTVAQRRLVKPQIYDLLRCPLIGISAERTLQNVEGDLYDWAIHQKPYKKAEELYKRGARKKLIGRIYTQLTKPPINNPKSTDRVLQDNIQFITKGLEPLYESLYLDV